MYTKKTSVKLFSQAVFNNHEKTCTISALDSPASIYVCEFVWYWTCVERQDTWKFYYKILHHYNLPSFGLRWVGLVLLCSRACHSFFNKEKHTIFINWSVKWWYYDTLFHHPSVVLGRRRLRNIFVHTVIINLNNCESMVLLGVGCITQWLRPTSKMCAHWYISILNILYTLHIIQLSQSLLTAPHNTKYKNIRKPNVGSSYKRVIPAKLRTKYTRICVTQHTILSIHRNRFFIHILLLIMSHNSISSCRQDNLQSFFV